MRTLVLLLCSLFSFSGAQAQSPEDFSLTAQPGPYAVGLSVVNQFDRSRVFLSQVDDLGRPTTGERSRPLQTLIWFPAADSQRAHVSVGDYLSLRRTETSFGDPAPSAGLVEWFVEGVPHSAETKTLAVMDAKPAQGRFPIVIYAPSFTAFSWENLDLCEYLASYGYLVIASPGMGVERDSTHDIAGINAQAQDISFLIGWAQTLPNADQGAAGVIGFSWGGISNIYAAARDSRIGALVALDGSARYFPGFVQQAGDVHPDTMTIPLLFFEGRGSLEGQEQLESRFKNASGPSVLNQWTHGDLVIAEMVSMIHPEFNTLSQRSERYWHLDFVNRKETDITRADGVVGYSWVARFTREFLAAYLKHDATALAFLKKTSDANGVPKHVMNTSFRAASPMPFTFADLRKAVADAGFEHVSDVYSASRKKEPAFLLSPDIATDWAFRLLGEHRFKESVDVMKLAIELEPSSRAYGSLGQIYANTGQKDLSIESFKKALAIDPQNIMAKEDLAAAEKNTGS